MPTRPIFFQIFTEIFLSQNIFTNYFYLGNFQNQFHDVKRSQFGFQMLKYIFSKPGLSVPYRGLDSKLLSDVHTMTLQWAIWHENDGKVSRGLRVDCVKKRVVLTPFRFTQSRLNRLIDFKSRRLVSFFYISMPMFCLGGTPYKNNTFHATCVASISWKLGWRAAARGRPRTHQIWVHGAYYHNSSLEILIFIRNMGISVGI